VIFCQSSLSSFLTIGQEACLPEEEKKERKVRADQALREKKKTTLGRKKRKKALSREQINGMAAEGVKTALLKEKKSRDM